MDAANKWTDKQLETIERRMKSVYTQAAKEMKAKQEKALAGYAKELEQREKALDDSQEALKAHKAWLEEQAAQQKYLSDMANQLAQDATKANQKALAMANDYVPGIYAENANYAAFTIDKAAKVDTMFSLVDENTVRELIKDDVMLLPEVNVPKDLRWNRQKFTSAITQGILQGESLPDIAERIRSVVGMNYNSACGAARLAITGAENAGRVHSYERAKKLGIELKQEWVATLDGRTRMSHRALDGEKVEVGEKFSNGCRYPGDPTAPGHEIWGCRCTLVAALDGLEDEIAERWSKLPDGMTYEEWKRVKLEKPSSGVVDGKSIVDTWQRRPDQFAFEIEDVISAQGFDGKPRVVGASEFDGAVKAANNGDGLIMQRVYSAPDKATLDAYRDSLYYGDWYVDCSGRGAIYGQGMYAAQAYGTEVTEGIEEAMRFYKDLSFRNGDKFSYVETMTLDPSAKIVRYDDVAPEFFTHNREALEKANAAKFEALEKSKQESLETFISQSSLPEEKFDAARIVINQEFGKQTEWEELVKAHEILGDEGREALVDIKMRYARQSNYLEQTMLTEDDITPGVFENMGSYFAANGYDAIVVDQGVGGHEIVVLNRTKLIIKEP